MKSRKKRAESEDEEKYEAKRRREGDMVKTMREDR